MPCASAVDELADSNAVRPARPAGPAAGQLRSSFQHFKSPRLTPQSFRRASSNGAAILEKPVSDRATLEDLSQSLPYGSGCGCKLLILNGEMSEWSIEHAWKTYCSISLRRDLQALHLPQPDDHWVPVWATIRAAPPRVPGHLRHLRHLRLAVETQRFSRCTRRTHPIRSAALAWDRLARRGGRG
jgi:hypothetical protein